MVILLEWDLVSSFEAEYNMNLFFKYRMEEFLKNEARSCSMDYGCVTLMYVYRMLGGCVPLKEIERAMSDVRRMM